MRSPPGRVSPGSVPGCPGACPSIHPSACPPACPRDAPAPMGGGRAKESLFQPDRPGTPEGAGGLERRDAAWIPPLQNPGVGGVWVGVWGFYGTPPPLKSFKSPLFPMFFTMGVGGGGGVYNINGWECVKQPVVKNRQPWVWVGWPEPRPTISGNPPTPPTPVLQSPMFTGLRGGGGGVEKDPHPLPHPSGFSWEKWRSSRWEWGG